MKLKHYLACILFLPTLAMAAGTHEHSHDDEKFSVGEPGKGAPDRVVKVSMLDSMRFVFEPQLETLRRGETIEFVSLRGQVVVVNFWASWCKPCEQEAAELQQAYKLYRDEGVAFLGVDYVDTETEARAYLQKFGITYPNGPDLGTRISQAFRIRGVPETYIIGPDGKLAAFKIGPYQSLDEIIQQIESVRAQ